MQRFVPPPPQSQPPPSHLGLQATQARQVKNGLPTDPPPPLPLTDWPAPESMLKRSPFHAAVLYSCTVVLQRRRRRTQSKSTCPLPLPAPLHCPHALGRRPDEIQIVVANSELAIEQGNVDKALNVLGNVSPESPAYVRVQVTMYQYLLLGYPPFRIVSTSIAIAMTVIHNLNYSTIAGWKRSLHNRCSAVAFSIERGNQKQRRAVRGTQSHFTIRPWYHGFLRAVDFSRKLFWVFATNYGNDLCFILGCALARDIDPLTWYGLCAQKKDRQHSSTML